MTLEADPQIMEEVRPRIGPEIRSVLPDVLARLEMAGLDRYGIEPPTPALLRRGSPALRHGHRYVRLDLRGVLPDRSAAQQHRLLSQRLLAPSVLRAVRDGRLRGWTLGRERPCVAARGRDRGVSSRRFDRPGAGPRSSRAMAGAGPQRCSSAAIAFRWRTSWNDAWRPAFGRCCRGRKAPGSIPGNTGHATIPASCWFAR